MESKEKQRTFVRKDVEELLRLSSLLPEPLRNAHLYITGGTGFLGSWLLEFISFLNEEHHFNIHATIACRDIHFFSRTREHLFKKKEFTFQETDVRNLGELPKETSHIIHAAAFTNRNQFATYPTHVSENNINSTIRIFRLAQQLGSLQNILLLSSGLVYGRQPLDVPDLNEDSFGGVMQSFDSNAIYAESKRASESIASAFLSESKLPVCVARPFAFVGPYQSLNLPWAVTDFIRDAIQGGPIKIMGDGSTVRSLMYASDFANWILHISAFATSRAVYNVGSPEPVDLLTLANRISACFQPMPKILTSVGNSPHHSDRLVPSIFKASSELGLKVTVDLQTAITRAVEWYRMARH